MCKNADSGIGARPHAFGHLACPVRKEDFIALQHRLLAKQ
jgi:hypothetical protein